MKDAKHIARLSGINIIINVINILTSVVTAKLFGVTRYIECFFAASLLSNVILSFTQTGQIVDFIIPKYIRLKNENNLKSASNLFSGFLNNQIVFGIFLTIIFIVANKYIVDLLVPGFGLDDKKLVTVIFLVLLPTIIINLIIGVLTSFLNAEGIYGRNEMINFFANVVYLIIVVVFHNQWGVMSLAYALLFSRIFAFIAEVYLLLTRSSLKYRLILYSESFTVKDFFNIIKITAYYSISVQVLNFSVNSSLSYQTPGTFAIYRYVESIFTKISSIILRPISTVIYTNINKETDREKIFMYIKDGLNLSLFLSISIFIISYATNFFGLRVLWEGRKFPLEDIIRAKWMLDIYMISLIILGTNAIYRKICISFASSELLFQLSSVAQIVSAIIAYVLIRFLHFEGILIFTIWHALLLTTLPLYIVRKYDKELYQVFLNRNTNMINYLYFTLICIACLTILYYTGHSYLIGIKGKIGNSIVTTIALIISSVLVYVFSKIFRLQDNAIMKKVNSYFVRAKQ